MKMQQGFIWEVDTGIIQINKINTLKFQYFLVMQWAWQEDREAKG